MLLNLREILRGLELDIASFNPDQIVLSARLLAHCSLNGPVGVAKATVFPTGEHGSIKELLKAPNLSNSSWKNVAEKFAVEIMKRDDIKDVIADCQQVRLHETVWPLWDVKKYVHLQT